VHQTTGTDTRPRPDFPEWETALRGDAQCIISEILRLSRRSDVMRLALLCLQRVFAVCGALHQQD